VDVANVAFVGATAPILTGTTSSFMRDPNRGPQVADSARIRSGAVIEPLAGTN